MAQESGGTAAVAERYDLAEGILWDDRANLVRWVDIREGRVLSARLDGTRLVDTRETRLRETVGAVALAADGGLLVAAARRLAAISPEGTVSFGPELLAEPRPMRFNDGAVDPQGRFVVGTLSLVGPIGAETLLRVSADGTVETLRSGIQLSNGVGWSPDGGTIYHVDTMAPSVSTHSYAAGEFDHDEPWVPLITEFAGHPDGLRVDRDGMLWVAMFGGACVVRYSPDDDDSSGREVQRIALDAQQPTCPGFVGPDLDRLAITTAIEHLTAGETLAGDGGIYIAATGATGIQTHRWGGSTTYPNWAIDHSPEQQ